MVENTERLRKARLVNLAPAGGEVQPRVRLEVTVCEQLEFMADHLDEMSVMAFGSGLETLGGLLRLARDEARMQGGGTMLPSRAVQR